MGREGDLLMVVGANRAVVVNVTKVKKERTVPTQDFGI
jgi:hypothetical protein